MGEEMLNEMFACMRSWNRGERLFVWNPEFYCTKYNAAGILKGFTRSKLSSRLFPSHSWTDLIVGAPNFFDRKAEIGGAVYVYLNPFGHWDDQARPIRLNGTYDSMFGITVSNIGDLDQDGYGG